MIIDSHSHAFPEKAIRDPEKWAREHGESHWGRLVLPRNGVDSLQGWVSRADFSQKMREDGIDGAVLLGWYWETPGACLIQNEEMADWLASHPHSFRACGAVHPQGPSPAEVVQWAVENRFSGFGELLPAVQQSSLADPFWDELANLSAEAGLCFNFHVNEPVGRPHGARIPVPFPELQAFIEKHPNLRIILSHWGGGLFLSELNPYIRKRFRNVFYDTSASPLLYGAEIFKVACQAVPPEKILFGSDFPLRLFPRREKAPGWRTFVEQIDQQGIADDAKAKIMSENARRVFGFGPEG